MADLDRFQSAQEVQIVTESGNSLGINADGTTDAFIQGNATTSFVPDTSNFIEASARATIDVENHLVTRGQVITDEGSFRSDFPSLSTTLTGTLTFTSGDTAVTGSGTAFLSEVKRFSYIRLSSGANSHLTRVASVESDTALTLDSGYVGSSGSGAATYTDFLLSLGTAATASVTNSILSLTSGVTSGQKTLLYRLGDYGPYNQYARFSLSQRVANQAFLFGFLDDFTTPTKGAYFSFSGVSNTVVDCVSQSSTNAADITTVSITLPGGATTAAHQRYEVNVTGDSATFLVNGIVVAKLQDHLPGPYDVLNLGFAWNNTGAVGSSTTASLDYLYFSNVDQLEVTSNFAGSPINIQNPIGQPVFRTGTLVTTATTADQQVLTYTVSASKTFYLKYLSMDAYVTTLPGNANPIRLGAISLETPSGTKVITVDRFHAPGNAAPFPLDIPITAGTVIRVVVTPAAATSYTWRANFGGYEI